MEPETFYILIAVLSIGAGLGIALFGRRSAGDKARMDQVYETLKAVTVAQQELAGRLGELRESTAQAQSALRQSLDTRLDAVTKQMGENLEKSAVKTAESLGELQTRLIVIDKAQQNITELSSQVVGLQDILANKQARGAFGQVQLNDLVRAALPPAAYQFEATLGNGRRADCLLRLPNPPGSIVVDAKFPLEAYYGLRDAKDDKDRTEAQRQFRNAILTHVKDIAERYIINGETADSALMFLPSEAVYAELHANFPEAVERSYRQKVWIVSPTTLMATLHTVRAVLKDAHMREQAHVIQKEVATMLEDVRRLDSRVESLRRHFGQADRDIKEIETSTGKIINRADRIEEIELGGDANEAALAEPEPETGAAREVAE